MATGNDRNIKSSRFPDTFAIIFGFLCLVFFLSLVFTGDLGDLFDVTPGGRRLDGIPLFMILLLGIAGLLFYTVRKNRSTKKT